MAASFWQRRWKLILNIVTIVGLVGFAIAIRHDLMETLKNLGRVNAWWLLTLIPIEMMNYHAQARLYQRVFAVVGNVLSYKSLMRVTIELNFVNHVFPSAGAAGISYFGLRLKSATGGITAAKATLVHIIKLALTFLTYEVLLIVGMLSLAAINRVNGLVILFGTAISILLIVATALFAHIVGSKARINRLFVGLTNVLNRIIHVFRPNSPETINVSGVRDVFDDFHHNYKLLRSSIPRLHSSFWWAMVMNATEILAIYVVFLAFGYTVNIGAIILAYGVANFAGGISVLPGGVGVYEFLMTAVLATTGVPVAVSIPVIVMYRVVSTLIQVPPGYILYQRNLSRAGTGRAG